MKTTLLEPTHPHSIPDRSHILTDMAMSNQNPLVTLSEAIAFNLAHPENRIQLDAYEDARFITACARALNQLDITEPERVNELIGGLRDMLDDTGKAFLTVHCDVAGIMDMNRTKAVSAE